MSQLKARPSVHVPAGASLDPRPLGIARVQGHGGSGSSRASVVDGQMVASVIAAAYWGRADAAVLGWWSRPSDIWLVTEVDSSLRTLFPLLPVNLWGPRQFSVPYELHVSILVQARSLEDPSSLFFSIATCCHSNSLHRIAQEKPMTWSLF